MTPVLADTPPIVTLTLNPCVDVSYDIPQLIEDQKVHAIATRLDPGGNGINVARALKRLRAPAWACATVAGEIGLLFERLIRGQIDHPHLVRIDGETRINTTLQQRQPRAQFEVSAAGPVIDEPTLDRISAEVLALTGRGYAVLTGSRSPGVPTSYYAELCTALRAQGARPVVDARGEALAQAVAARPYLIKPNRFELEQLLGRPLPTRDDVLRAAATLHAQGVDWVCVSMGGEGAVLVGAETYIGQAPQVQVVSTVGAGDSMVGGLVAALSRGETPAEALRLALACGSGTSEQPGTELFDPLRLAELKGRTVVQRIG
ncbi:MAG: 1-phosphofructokinase family hexose kinase [Thiomonas sp.]|uniref:1-phosphofructokinase family hexose kinase n=1 Tax=Thiomonas sp. TaxID=2047785 RepID=UPI002A35E27A|nr:1-phosphofructokinase family hexose kinase [Thiomonas sp.]MDY0329983.1 1-phosphofructokinase family hexose kinase [Thiomonas sp.]